MYSEIIERGGEEVIFTMIYQKHLKFCCQNCI